MTTIWTKLEHWWLSPCWNGYPATFSLAWFTLFVSVMKRSAMSMLLGHAELVTVGGPPCGRPEHFSVGHTVVVSQMARTSVRNVSWIQTLPLSRRGSSSFSFARIRFSLISILSVVLAVTGLDAQHCTITCSACDNGRHCVEGLYYAGSEVWQGRNGQGFLSKCLTVLSKCYSPDTGQRSSVRCNWHDLKSHYDLMWTFQHMMKLVCQSLLITDRSAEFHLVKALDVEWCKSLLMAFVGRPMVFWFWLSTPSPHTSPSPSWGSKLSTIDTEALIT